MTDDTATRALMIAESHSYCRCCAEKEECLESCTLSKDAPEIWDEILEWRVVLKALMSLSNKEASE